MRNIDSEFKCTPQDRFAMKRVWIRKLRIIDPFPSSSAAC
jgi:hypothetical protein